MPTLEEEGWELDDAEARHAEAPGSFSIPSRAERIGLRVGDRVKLLFLFDNREDGSSIIDCERMWVTITEVDGQAYVGQLESLPCTSDILAPLQEIRFGPEHVATVLIRKSAPRHPDFRGGN